MTQTAHKIVRQWRTRVRRRFGRRVGWEKTAEGSALLLYNIAHDRRENGPKAAVCGGTAQNASPVRRRRTGDRANCTNAFWF